MEALFALFIIGFGVWLVAKAVAWGLRAAYFVVLFVGALIVFAFIKVTIAAVVDSAHLGPALAFGAAVIAAFAFARQRSAS